MFEVVINSCYGGFGLSDAAYKLIAELKGDVIEEGSGDYYDYNYMPRHDPHLVEAVKKLGDDANDEYAELRVVTVYGDRYRIEEYDGYESCVEPDDVNWVVYNP